MSRQRRKSFLAIGQAGDEGVRVQFLDPGGKFGDARGIAIEGEYNDVIRMGARHAQRYVTTGYTIHFVAVAAKKIGALVRVEARASDNEHPLAGGNRFDRETRFLSH